MGQKKIKMLSLDLSTTKSGIAYWENNKYKESYVIDFSSVKDIDERVVNMSKMLINALNYFKPNIVYSEDSFKGKNPVVLKMLSRIHGVVMGWSLSHNTEYHFIMPSSWRKHIPDFPNGRGVKREVEKAFSIKYVTDNYGFIPKTDDESDAILIGESVVRMNGKK